MLAVPGEEKEHACVGIRVEEDQASAYAAAEDEEPRLSRDSRIRCWVPCRVSVVTTKAFFELKQPEKYQRGERKNGMVNSIEHGMCDSRLAFA